MALLHTFKGHTADVNAVDCGPVDNSQAGGGSTNSSRWNVSKTFATGSSDGTSKIWDLQTGKWTCSFSAYNSGDDGDGGGGGSGGGPVVAEDATDAAITGVAMSDDGNMLATGGMDGTVRTNPNSNPNPNR
jgi:WD40 repeat protein